MSGTSPSSAVLTFPVPSPVKPRREGFADLDDTALAAEPGALVVRVRDEERGSILAHVARRLRAAGGCIVDVRTPSSTSVFREAATRLGLGAVPHAPSAFAAALASASPSSRRVAILSRLPHPGSWDDAVARELVAQGNTVLVFATSSTLPAWESTTFDVTADLTVSDRLRWLDAIVQGSERKLRDDGGLHGLDSWWRRTRYSLDGEDTLDESVLTQRLSAPALEVATCVALARRSIPLTAFDQPHIDDLVEELRAAHVITDGKVALVLHPSADATWLEAHASREARELTARILLGETGAFQLDPWAYTRSAELLLAEHPMTASDAMDRACRAARDSRLAADIAEAWFTAVSVVKGEDGLELRLRGAERALAEGKPKDALRWYENLSDSVAHEPRVRLILARARAQLGDLVTSRLVLDRIRVAKANHELRATIAAERSEVDYLTGDLDAATADAQAAIALTASPRTRLAARNVLGKILLARGAWDDADSHFAADSLAAQSVGETSADLRARLNRAIALLSKGMLDEARQTLLGVLADGERLDDLRAVARALSNLGVVAYRLRDYTAALSYWEATIKQWDLFGGGIEVASPLANVADLRLKLGLTDNAEHAIRFGQKALAGHMTPALAAQFKLVAAQVALVRGFSEIANDEVQSALVHARASGDVEYVAASALVGARVALADGDVRRAEEWIAVATENAKTARSVAEVAMLRAAYLRALGRPALAPAKEALTHARAAADDDLLLDVHALIATCSHDERDIDRARSHCRRAAAIRDRIASTLPSDVREAFLSKPEMRSLARLQQALVSLEPNVQAGQAAPAPQAPLEHGTARERPRVHGVELVGNDPQMRSLALAVRKAALSQSTVLISGESGTGKELVARALHAASPRASGPLVVVNCAALVETLLLSELFGHEKGSFTGATARRRGRFEIADGGTLFLDEIGDISPRTQVALLRVLQERTFERIGGTTTLRSDARVVCATHRDLRTMVERGEFREDLYYRIRGITIEVPPLRARPGDIPLLANHLLASIASEQQRKPKRLAPDALELLLRHRWPGNVRELENVLRATSVFAEGETITLSDLLGMGGDLGVASGSGSSPPHETTSEPEPPITEVVFAHVREHRVSLHEMKRQIERDCITRALEESKGNITRAAELLGMKRPRVSQLAKQYGLTATASEDER